jgi:EAL domain-containing protein (putative c-di-GMP-specific phosphodiesterase class I)
VPIAEQSGLIVAIGAWVLREACDQAVAWTRSTGTQVMVAVNLSPRQLGAGDLGTLVRRVLRDTGLAAHRLCLEITESAVMTDPQTAIDTLRGTQADRRAPRDRRLRRRLFLAEPPARHAAGRRAEDDRSFVARLGAQTEDGAIVTAVVELARALKLVTVAEGVETAEQAELVADLGCHVAQGFYFARPQRPGDVERLLDAEVAREQVA